MENGRVAYLVLSFGSVRGMGGKLFAVPWDDVLLKYGEVGKYFILDVDREKLNNAPGFDENNWPDMSHPDWAAQIDAHYRRGRPHERTERKPASGPLLTTASHEGAVAAMQRRAAKDRFASELVHFLRRRLLGHRTIWGE